MPHDLRGGRLRRDYTIEEAVGRGYRFAVRSPGGRVVSVHLTRDGAKKRLRASLSGLGCAVTPLPPGGLQ